MARKRPNRLLRILRVTWHRRHYSLAIGLIPLVFMVWGVLHYEWEVEPVPVPAPRTWSEIVASDTLRVVSLRSSYTVFEYRGNYHGHEFENAMVVASSLGLNLEVLLVETEQALVDSLFSGAADVAIWPMSYTASQKHWYLRPTGPRWADNHCVVTVHRKESSVDDSTALSIDTIVAGSISAEQLTDSLLAGSIDAVRMRANVARLMHDYYPSLELSDTLPGTRDTLAWMVTSGADTLMRLIDSVACVRLEKGTPHYLLAHKRYLSQRTKAQGPVVYQKVGDGISAYDEVFRRSAAEHELDWRFLAGIAFVESHFNHNIVAAKGPLGLMQLMPATVRSFGYETEEALDADINVSIAAALVARLRTIITRRFPEIPENDLNCFVLAAYNAGYGHVSDAIALADTLGYRTDRWNGNVEHCLRLKADPQYYRMSVVKQGRFNGDFTINYVNNVLAAYRTFCAAVPRESTKEKQSNKKKKQ